MGRHLIRVQKSRFTRLRALLAGGLVLGVGTTATLAAWTDEEHAAGSFEAGTFSIVGSADGTSFSEHSGGSGASLAFDLEPTAMVPGTTVYALYSVKTELSSVAGSLELTETKDNELGLGKYLRYGVHQIAGIDCNAATFAAASEVVIPSDSMLTAGSAGKLALAAAGVVPINYCFAVTLPADADTAAQGTTLSAQWTFVASTDPVAN